MIEWQLQKRLALPLAARRFRFTNFLLAPSDYFIYHCAMTRFMGIAALLLALGVAMGAFGAHGLKGRLDAYHMAVYEKAVLYHLIHALGILAVAAIGQSALSLQPQLTRVCLLLLFGVLIFSGSLYGLALSGFKALGAITPIGGLAFIAAWLMLAYCLFTAET